MNAETEIFHTTFPLFTHTRIPAREMRIVRSEGSPQLPVFVLVYTNIGVAIACQTAASPKEIGTRELDRILFIPGVHRVNRATTRRLKLRLCSLGWSPSEQQSHVSLLTRDTTQFDVTRTFSPPPPLHPCKMQYRSAPECTYAHAGVASGVRRGRSCNPTDAAGRGWGCPISEPLCSY